MAKLHELLAVEGEIEGTYKKILDETETTFSKKPVHFIGVYKTLEMFDDNAPKPPEEHKAMDTTVQEKLDYMAEHVIRYLDIMLQKDKSNQIAVQDLEVDGLRIAPAMPAVTLLGLENKLKQVRKVYNAIPTLAPGVEWVSDETAEEGTYKLKHPEEKFKTAKTFKHKVLVEAKFPEKGQGGNSQPAQIERWEETENVGKYVITTTCGMMSPAEKSLMLGRIDRLIREVKKARQRANCAAADESTMGKLIFNYIHAI